MAARSFEAYSGPSSAADDSVRVVLTCWGSLGDFYPFLALAVELKDMGHQPVLATCELYRQRTLDAGVAFLQKPFTPTLLVSRIRELLETAR